jgi:hypothetical protein
MAGGDEAGIGASVNSALRNAGGAITKPAVPAAAEHHRRHALAAGPRERGPGREYATMTL